jgi:hypothetical protein
VKRLKQFNLEPKSATEIWWKLVQQNLKRNKVKSQISYMKLKKPRRLDRVIWIRSLTHGTRGCISVYINLFANSSVLQLYYDMIFRNNFLSNKLHTAPGSSLPPSEKSWLLPWIRVPAGIHTVYLDTIFGPAVAPTHPASCRLYFLPPGCNTRATRTIRRGQEYLQLYWQFSFSCPWTFLITL